MTQCSPFAVMYETFVIVVHLFALASIRASHKPKDQNTNLAFSLGFGLEPFDQAPCLLDVQHPKCRLQEKLAQYLQVAYDSKG